MGHDRSPSRAPGLFSLLDVLAVDGGLAVATIGLALTNPPLIPIGLILLAVGLLLPVRAPRLPESEGVLDAIIPTYEFGEHHEIRIDAPLERVDAAVRAVTARDIRFFRLLTWIRSPRLRGREESVLNPGADTPIVDVATRSGFVLLRDDPPRVIVFGAILGRGARPTPRTAAEFHARAGSVVRAVMGFHASAEAGGATRLVTQTRVHATDSAAERRFAAYWRLIYPGSAFIRRMWLRAIRARAEAGRQGPGPTARSRDASWREPGTPPPAAAPRGSPPLSAAR